MRFKIGVMGSASEFMEEAERKVFELGREIAKHDCVLITGATTGLPYAASRGVKKENGLSIGISPARDEEEHTIIYKKPTDSYDVIIYTGFGFKGRNVINIRACDFVIFVGGSTGTLNEFTIAYDEGKVIGVLQGTGGISDNVKKILEVCKKDPSKIIYNKDPKKLIEALLK